MHDCNITSEIRLPELIEVEEFDIFGCPETKLDNLDNIEVDNYGGFFSNRIKGGRRSPAVACWASDHWVARSNPLRGKFRH